MPRSRGDIGSAEAVPQRIRLTRIDSAKQSARQTGKPPSIQADENQLSGSDQCERDPLLMQYLSRKWLAAPENLHERQADLDPVASRLAVSATAVLKTATDERVFLMPV